MATDDTPDDGDAADALDDVMGDMIEQQAETLVERAARGLVSTLGGDPSEFDQAMSEHVGHRGGVPAAAVSGMTLGMDWVERRRAYREMGDEPDDPTAAPPVHFREIEQDGEFAGLRVLVADQHVEVMTGTLSEDQGHSHTLTVRGEGYEVVEPIGFEPGKIEWVNNDGLAEFIIHRATGESDLDIEVEEPADDTAADEATDEDVEQAVEEAESAGFEQVIDEIEAEAAEQDDDEDFGFVSGDYGPADDDE